MSSKSSDEWYTPPEVFDAMSIRFNVDVCAPVGGVSWIPADRYLTALDDALVQPWLGRVWMNPPYSGPGPFVKKFLDHGNGIALVPLSKSRWFGELWASKASLVVPANPSIKFIREGKPKQIFLPMAFVAIGPEVNHQAIRRLGRVR
jgi:hypothetical protein